jgi:hypothetical protein
MTQNYREAQYDDYYGDGTQISYPKRYGWDQKQLARTQAGATVESTAGWIGMMVFIASVGALGLFIVALASGHRGYSQIAGIAFAALLVAAIADFFFAHRLPRR